jgi:ParB-like chromosome segregation protein Spo0J
MTKSRTKASPGKGARPHADAPGRGADEKAWPAYNVERVPIADLHRYARNSKIHTDEDVTAIARAIQEFGFTNSILRDEDGTIIAGHARVLALHKLGYKYAPVISAKGWTPEQRRAFVIWDNKSAEKAQWNDQVLKVELLDLKASGFDLSLTGFGSDEIVTFIAGGGSATAQPPGVFQEVDENLPTEHCCPQCGYRWSGAAGAGAARGEPAAETKARKKAAANGKGGAHAAVAGHKAGRNRPKGKDQPRRGAGARAHG